MMAECTELERELLDKMAERSPHGYAQPLGDLRMQILISRIPPELHMAAVKAQRMLNDARAFHAKVWDQMHALGVEGQSKAADAYYDRIEAEAKEPQ